MIDDDQETFGTKNASMMLAQAKEFLDKIPKPPVAIIMSDEFYEKFLSNPQVANAQKMQQNHFIGLPVRHHPNMIEDCKIIYSREELDKFWQMLEQRSLELLFTTAFANEAEAAIAVRKLGGICNMPCHNIQWQQNGKTIQANLVEDEFAGVWVWIKGK